MDIPSSDSNKSTLSPQVSTKSVAMVDLAQALRPSQGSNSQPATNIAQVAQAIKLTSEVLSQLLQQLPKNAGIYPELSDLSEKSLTNNSNIISSYTLAKLILKAEAQSIQRMAAWALVPIALSVGQKIQISANPQNHALSFNLINSSTVTQTQFSRVSSHENTITEALKQNIPRAERDYSILQNLLSSDSPSNPLLKLAERSNNPTVKTLSALIPLIKTWSKTLPDVSHLNHTAVKRALLNSGTFFENRLSLASLANTTNATGVNYSKSFVGAELTQTSIQPQSENAQTSEKKTLNFFNSDLKAILLAVINVNQSMLGSLSQNKSDKLLEGLVQIFVGLLRGRQPNQDQQNKDPRRLILELDKQLQGLRASITSNQLSSIQNTQQDPGSLNINTDFILKLHDTILPIRLIIEQRKQKKDEGTEKKQKKREWRFFIAWSFPDQGQFNAEVKLYKDRNSFRLWVENKIVRKRMKTNINKLLKQFEAKNINIDAFQFAEQAFVQKPETPAQLDRLIDVRT